MHFKLFIGLACLLAVVPSAISTSVPYPTQPKANLAEVKKYLTHAAEDNCPGPEPNATEILTHLTKVANDSSLFYSKRSMDPDEKNDLEKEAKMWRNKDEKRRNFKILDEMWDQYWGCWARCWGNKQENDFWVPASQIMADISSGTVYVMLPKCTTKCWIWNENSVWHRTEWPALQCNPYVAKVIRVNPSDDREVTLFDRTTHANAYATDPCDVINGQYPKNAGPLLGVDGEADINRLDVHIYDNGHNEMERIERADVSPPDRLGVRSRQRYMMQVTLGEDQDGPGATFKSGAQSLGGR